MYSSSATQKGVAYFKSAARPFFYNSETIGPSELQNYFTNLITYPHFKFQLSRINGSRVIEKGMVALLK